MIRHSLRFVLGAVLGLAVTNSALAQGSKAQAEALFQRGRELMDAGDVAEACRKFEQSEKLDSAPGTLLNLAVCYERSGRTASAWLAYRRAAARARAEGQESRQAAAIERAAALEGRVNKVVVEVPESSRVEGLTVAVDDEPLDAALWGQPVPVDPGAHRIVASAPGHTAQEQALNVTGEGELKRVSIPALIAAAGSVAPPIPSERPAPPPPVASPTADTATSSTQRTVGYIVGGAGILTLGVSGFFALRTASKNDESKEHCASDDSNLCTSRGLELRDQAQTAGNVATVTGLVGLAALGTGVVLVLTSPSSAELTAGVGLGRVQLTGRF